MQLIQAYTGAKDWNLTQHIVYTRRSEQLERLKKGDKYNAFTVRKSFYSATLTMLKTFKEFMKEEIGGTIRLFQHI